MSRRKPEPSTAPVPATMTKAERTELGQLIRKRERVMKAAAQERALQLMAEFEAQCARIYSFDDDQVWEAATRAAEEAVKAAQETIAARCRELGIPGEFAPGLSFGWYGRGQNAVAGRRAELRRAAQKRIDAIWQEAIVKIERLSLTAQTEVIAQGLQSAAAREFLERMPPLESLMPTLDAQQVKAVVDQRFASRDLS